MRDFLSKLIARSFTDAPVIQPRVPSLFEPTAVEFFDEQESSTIESVLELSPGEKSATAKSIAKAFDARAEERLPKPDTPAHQHVPVSAKPAYSGEQTAEGRKLEIETKRIMVPLGPEPPPIQPRRRKDFSTAEQRSSTSLPIIRVTIGRVEVRAVHSPAPAPKSAKPAPPKLSLEDYLHKRERGSR